MVMLKAAPIMSQRDMEFVTAWTILVVTLVTSVVQGSLGMLQTTVLLVTAVVLGASAHSAMLQDTVTARQT
jgi:hypothetical protein